VVATIVKQTGWLGVADVKDIDREPLEDPFRLKLPRDRESVIHSSSNGGCREPSRNGSLAHTTDGAFNRIAQLAVQLFGVPIAIVSVAGEERAERGLGASVSYAQGVHIGESAQLNPQSLVDPVVAAKCGLRFYAAASLEDSDGNQVGTLCILDRRARKMSSEQEGVLTLLARTAMDHVEFHVRASKTISTERLFHIGALQLAQDKSDLYQREHRVAAALQTSMLPKAFPEIDKVRFDAVYVPAGSDSIVGGDWYDAYRLDEDHLLLSIGDVAGHGVMSAALVGLLRHSLRAFAMTERSPKALLKGLDALLRSEHDQILVTSLILMVDLRERTLRYANAGHPPALLREPDGRVVELGETGLPLGLRSQIEPGDITLSIPEKSLLVLYTDGLIESTRNALEGHERLKVALADEAFGTCDKPAYALCERLLPGVLADDVAIMSVVFS